MKGIDIIKELSPSQQIAIQGDVSEEYSENWWQKMVEDSLTFVSQEQYLQYRHEQDVAVIDCLISRGNAPDEHLTKLGKYKIGSIFQNKKAYSNYRSNKSIIAGCIEHGISLKDGDNIVPKTAAQKLLKEKKADQKPERTAYDRAMSYVDKLGNVWGELSSDEQIEVSDKLNAFTAPF